MSHSPYASPHYDGQHPTNLLNKTLLDGPGQYLIQNAFWIRMIGIYMLFAGVMMCLTIVGIVVGWAPIWAGVSLMTEGSIFTKVGNGQHVDINEGYEKLGLGLKITGILALITLIFTVLYIMLYVAIIVLFVAFAVGGGPGM